MTEEEWLGCNQVLHLYQHLRTTYGVNKSKSGRRKLRLFGCGVCRRAIHLSSELPQYSILIQAADRLADGNVSAKEVQAITRPKQSSTLSLQTQDLVGAACALVESNVENVALDAATFVGQAMSAVGWTHVREKRLAEDAQHAILFRCIFGNPFRRSAFKAKWRSTEVVQMAQVIYDNRDFQNLPMLAKALVNAGCTDQEILEHCRSSGPHAKGCWVIDLVLGVE